MMTRSVPFSCGFRVGYGIDYYNADLNFADLLRSLKRNKCAHVAWSDQGNGSRGDKLAAYIRKRYPGSITQSSPNRNPNTFNILYVWVWAVPAGLKG